MEQTTLYYREGSSDKVYHAAITPEDGGYVVNFAYGRRGTTLQTGTKTAAPVHYEQAKKVYDKLVQEKKAKGYTVADHGTLYRHTDKANDVSGINCQLLNPIDGGEVQRFIDDPDFCAQEKFDGRRMIVRKQREVIEAINRKGLRSGIPAPLAEEIWDIPGDIILDGESVGEVLFAFDLLELHGRDIRNQPYQDRLFALNQVISRAFGFVKLADTALHTAEKTALLKRLRRENREGIVFKDLSAGYIAGRPASGGANLKYKFHVTASFIVNRVNGKRSVSMMLFDGHKVVPVGNVTIPPNHKIPAVGEIVEVRYLYAFRGGSIYQPVYLGVRTDIAADECTVSQLKIKADQEEAVAA